MTTNVTVVELAATVTFAGTLAAVLLLVESATTAPPVDAGPFRVTLAVDVAPPITVVGFKVMEVTEGEFTDSVAAAAPL